MNTHICNFLKNEEKKTFETFCSKVTLTLATIFLIIGKLTLFEIMFLALFLLLNMLIIPTLVPPSVHLCCQCAAEKHLNLETTSTLL